MFNIFDWELGRNFWVSKALSLRPFLGLKGGWIHQSIHTKWQNPTRVNPRKGPLIPFTTEKRKPKKQFLGYWPQRRRQYEMECARPPEPFF